MSKRAISVPLDETTERIDWADRAWAEATAVDDPVALSLACRVRCWNALAPAHLDEAVDLAARGLAAARRTGDFIEIHESVFTQLLIATILGDFDEFDRIERERTAQAERGRRPRQLELGVGIRARKLLLSGEFDAAESAILEAEALYDRFGSSQRALPVSTLQAIWRLANGLDASRELAIAKFWAAEGGHRVCYAAQHLHGGIGVDTDYPLHHYYLRSRHLELTLGGAHTHLALLGDRLAAQGPAASG